MCEKKIGGEKKQHLVIGCRKYRVKLKHPPPQRRKAHTYTLHTASLNPIIHPPTPPPPPPLHFNACLEVKGVAVVGNGSLWACPQSRVTLNVI